MRGAFPGRECSIMTTHVCARAPFSVGPWPCHLTHISLENVGHHTFSRGLADFPTVMQNVSCDCYYFLPSL